MARSSTLSDELVGAFVENPPQNDTLVPDKLHSAPPFELVMEHLGT